MRRSTLFLSLILAASAASAQDFSKVEVTASKVSGAVYMLTGAGGNIGVSVGDDGVVIVDDQYAPLAPKIAAALASITDKPVKFVINTHYHGDHTGGNEALGRKGGTIIAHDNARKYLAEGTTLFGEKVAPSPKEALPIVTFDRTLTLHVNGEDVKAVHFPHGHTDGDAVIYFPRSNVVHMGDDFFNGMFPFVDMDHGGRVSGMLANIEKVLSNIPDDAKIIPGHGPLGDKAALRRFATMLRETSAAVRAARKSGKTVDQMKKAKILSKWDSWASSFVTTDIWIETIARDQSIK